MPEFKVREQEPLARHTTLRIGGAADYFIRVDSRAELIDAADWGRRRKLPILILGNGSNILVSDAGFRGLVIENHAAAEEWERHENKLRVRADSGVLLPGLANRLARQGWSGLEWAIGVPGTVGAAVVTNAGAHGGSFGDTLLRALVLQETGSMWWWERAELELDYRTSIFKHTLNRSIVLAAELELHAAEPTECVARMNRYTEHRRRTQPTEPSVGSMFKNPRGDYAGRLIEAAGLKGMRVGNIAVSQVHANFFVNLGGATSADVLELVERVQSAVYQKFRISLELEIQIVA